MMGEPDDHLVESALTDLVRDYDKHWSSLDFVWDCRSLGA